MTRFRAIILSHFHQDRRRILWRLHYHVHKIPTNKELLTFPTFILDITPQPKKTQTNTTILLLSSSSSSNQSRSHPTTEFYFPFDCSPSNIRRRRALYRGQRATDGAWRHCGQHNTTNTSFSRCTTQDSQSLFPAI